MVFSLPVNLQLAAEVAGPPPPKYKKAGISGQIHHNIGDYTDQLFFIFLCIYQTKGRPLRNPAVLFLWYLIPEHMFGSINKTKV